MRIELTREVWRRPGWWAMMIAIGVFISLVILNATTHRMITANSSEADGYFIQAEQLLRGEPYLDRYRPPLYVALTAVLSWVTRLRPFVAGMIVSSIAAGVLVGLTYTLAQWFMSPYFALLAELLVAIDSLVIFHGLQVSTDALFASLSMTALVLSIALLRQPSRRVAQLIALGAIVGGAYLTRYTAVFLAPVVLYAVWQSSSVWRVRLKRVSIVTITTIIVTLPWLVYNTKINGSPLTNDNWRNFAFAVSGGGNWQDFDAATANMTGAGEVIAREPARVLKLWVQNSLDVVQSIPMFHTSSPILAIFLPIGLALSIRDRIGRVLVLYSMSCGLVILLTFFYLERLLLPVTPVLIIIAMRGLAWSLPHLLKWRIAGRVLVSATFVTVLVLPWLRWPARMTAYLAAQPTTEVHMLDQLIAQVGGSVQPPIRVVSMYEYAGDFVQQPDWLQNYAVPSWLKRDYYQSDQFKQTLSDMAAAHQAQYVLISDRLTQGTIESGRADNILSGCWSLEREAHDFTGRTRLYQRTCPW